MNENLTENQKRLALKFKALSKCSLKEAFRWSLEHFDAYQQYLAKHIERFHFETQDIYLEKEFKSRGYIPRDQVKHKRGLDYIESNRMINGIWYSYPKPGHSGCYRKKYHKYPNIYKMQEEIGIMGYTKVALYHPLQQ